MGSSASKKTVTPLVDDHANPSPNIASSDTETIAPFDVSRPPNALSTPPDDNKHVQTSSTLSDNVDKPPSSMEIDLHIPPNVLFAVSDEAGAADRVAIPLESCFDCPEWRDLVEQCSQKLFLVASTFDEYSSLPNARVLSYRWREVITTNCSVTVPGKESSEVKSCTFCADAFDCLRDFTGGYLWIDYLCHLNDSQHKVHVMGQMGPLYWKGVAVPAYLMSVDMKETHAFIEGGKIDGELYERFSVVKQSSDSLLAMRRGWIQQEITFGRLDSALVKQFVYNCVKNQYYGLLGTLIRRRVGAMRWMFVGSRDTESEKAESLLFLDTNVQDMKHVLSRILRKSSEGGVVSTSVQDAIRRIISTKLKALSPELHQRILAAGAAHRALLSPQLLNMRVTEVEAAKNSGTNFYASKALTALASDVYAIDQSEGFDFNLCGPTVGEEVVDALQLYLDEMVTQICEPVMFNASDFFCACQLLRGFGESALTVESDATCALTQVAAVSAGMSWEPSAEGDLSGTSLKLLVMCWETVLAQVLKHELCLEFSVVRSNASERTMGLLRLLREDVMCLDRVYFRCGKLLIFVRDVVDRSITVACVKENEKICGIKIRKVEELFRR